MVATLRREVVMGRDVGERSEPRAQQGMVEAGPAVEREQRRLLAQRRSEGLELTSLDFEEETDIVDEDPHGVPQNLCKGGCAGQWR